jgi:glucan 1,3-beta-glucosidase
VSDALLSYPPADRPDWSLVPLVAGEPYLPGAFDYLKLGVNWAQQAGLSVMIDLHGAPGSQNGFDNSGYRGPREWFWNQTNADRSVDALKVLVAEFSQAGYANTVTAIGLLNEPFPANADQVGYLREFLQGSYASLRALQTQQHLVLVLDSGRSAVVRG